MHRPRAYSIMVKPALNAMGHNSEQFVELQAFNALNEILLEYGKKFMISGMVMKFKKFRIFIDTLK